MKKRLECTVLFYGEPYAKVYTEYPYDTVGIRGLSKKFDGEHIIDDFWAITGEDDEPIFIEREKDPINYVAYLYQGLSGSYFAALESKTIGDEEVLQKEEEPVKKKKEKLIKEEPEEEEGEIINLDIPNIDYDPSTLNWLHENREEE